MTLECETKVWVEVVEMLRWFAGRQTRNVSSVAGNVVTSSPISDLNPLFQAAQSRIFLQSSGISAFQIDIVSHNLFLKGAFLHAYYAAIESPLR